MWYYVLMCVVLVLGGGHAAVDLTLTDYANDRDVVGIVVDLIRQSCIFKDDKLILRRIAFAETKDGTANFTFYQNSVFKGGIWQISEMNFRAARTATAEIIDGILNEFNIDWLNTMYSDLKKPLYSGLAARLLIDDNYRTIGEQIPQSTDGQALYWARNYTINDWGGQSAAIDVYSNASDTVKTDCTSPNADIVFLLDGSDSVTANNFQLMLDFVVGVVGSFDISQNKVRVGVIEFSSSAVPQFNLSTYRNKQDVQNAVRNITYSAGGSNTSAGLNALISMIAAEGRHKQGVAVTSIVLTDGQSDSPVQTNASAERLHRELPEVTVFSVGVGSGVAFSELTAIASLPSCLNVFQLSDFNDISSFNDQITEQICKVPALMSPTSTINGSVGYNQTYYFKTIIAQQQIVLRVKALNGKISAFLSRKIRNPNMAMHDYFAEVDDSMIDGKDLLISWNTSSTADVVGTVYGSVVGVQQTNNQYELSYTENIYVTGDTTTTTHVITTAAGSSFSSSMIRSYLVALLTILAKTCRLC